MYDTYPKTLEVTNSLLFLQYRNVITLQNPSLTVSFSGKVLILAALGTG